MRIRAELAGAQAALGATSTGSALSTLRAETRSMSSALSVAASAVASIGAPEAKGTKPLLSGPRMGGVRNMRSFFFDGFRGAIVRVAGGILDKSHGARAIACVRKTTQAIGAPLARGFVHEHRCER